MNVRTNRQNAAGAFRRVVVALVLSALSLWCAWAALRAGASRVLSDYAGRAGLREPAEGAVALAPSDPEALYARAGVLADSGDYAAAAKAYVAALALRPRDHVLWTELGRAREEANDPGGALDAYGRATALAPNYARPRWQLGNALLRAGRVEEAFAELRRAAEADPSLYPNFIDTLWHASGKDRAALAREAQPRTPEQTLAVVRFLIREGAAPEGMAVLRESGARVSEESRRDLLKELLAAEDFADAYEVWSDGRAPALETMTDGGFEGEVRADEEGFGWRFARDKQAVRFSLDPDSPREGSRSLKVEYAGNSEPSAGAVSQLVRVEPGARYRLTFSARAKGLVTGGPPFVQVLSAAKSGGALASAPALSPAAQDWQDFALEFEAPRNSDAVRVELRRQPCVNSPCPAFGSVWLDAFALRRL